MFSRLARASMLSVERPRRMTITLLGMPCCAKRRRISSSSGFQGLERRIRVYKAMKNARTDGSYVGSFGQGNRSSWVYKSDPGSRMDTVLGVLFSLFELPRYAARSASQRAAISENRGGDDVFGGDQLYVLLLAPELRADGASTAARQVDGFEQPVLWCRYVLPEDEGAALAVLHDFIAAKDRSIDRDVDAGRGGLRRRERHAEVERGIAFAESGRCERTGQHDRFVGYYRERSGREGHRVGTVRDDNAGEAGSTDVLDDSCPVFIREIEAVLAQHFLDLMTMSDARNSEQLRDHGVGDLESAKGIEILFVDRAACREYEDAVGRIHGLFLLERVVERLRESCVDGGALPSCQ